MLPRIAWIHVETNRHLLPDTRGSDSVCAIFYSRRSQEDGMGRISAPLLVMAASAAGSPAMAFSAFWKNMLSSSLRDAWDYPSHLLRAAPITPSRPVPSKNRVEGSGVAAGATLTASGPMSY